MTVLVYSAAAVAILAALVVLLRARVAAARRQTHAAVEALHAELGLPADRCRLVDVPLAESIAAALRPWQRLPRFEHVHRVPHHPNRFRRQS